ncbi:MAG: type II toxin-antitoxin system HicB family antitoxin [Patescibacteria group bacterium]
MKKTKKIYNFTAIFESAEEGGYVVRVPAIPGCMTQGETFEEAERMAKDAIEGCLEVLKDTNEEIPAESDNFIITKIPAEISR